jgi:hypothetical protein
MYRASPKIFDTFLNGQVQSRLIGQWKRRGRAVLHRVGFLSADEPEQSTNLASVGVQCSRKGFRALAGAAKVFARVMDRENPDHRVLVAQGSFAEGALRLAARRLEVTAVSLCLGALPPAGAHRLAAAIDLPCGRGPLSHCAEAQAKSRPHDDLHRQRIDPEAP